MKRKPQKENRKRLVIGASSYHIESGAANTANSPSILVFEKRPVLMVNDTETGVNASNLRIPSGVTLEVLSAKLKVHKVHLSNLELGKRSWSPEMAARYQKAVLSIYGRKERRQ